MLIKTDQIFILVHHILHYINGYGNELGLNAMDWVKKQFRLSKYSVLNKKTAKWNALPESLKRNKILPFLSVIRISNQIQLFNPY